MGRFFKPKGRFGKLARPPALPAALVAAAFALASMLSAGLATSPKPRLRADNAAAACAGRWPCFAVTMSAYHRDSDPGFRLPCLMSLSSLARQTYPAWVLVMVGDGLSSRQVARLRSAVAASAVPAGNVALLGNMDAALREHHVYARRGGLQDPRAKLSWFAGINAVNMALRAAYSLPGVSHFARLDDDDVWEAGHLANLAAAYIKHPDAGFAYTQALGWGDDPIRVRTPFPGGAPNGSITLRPPKPCGLIHSAASAAVGLRIFGRQEWEQAATTRSMPRCCNLPECGPGNVTVMEADADAWERVWGMVDAGETTSLFVAEPSVYYTGAEMKKCVGAVVAAGTGAAPECAVAQLAHVPITGSACLSL